MIKKIISIINIISFFCLTFLIISMLPFIFQAKWQGMLCIITFIILLIFELVLLLSKKNYVKYTYVHQIFVILITIYFSCFYYKVYTIQETLYGVDINYCQNNYLYLSILFIFTSFAILSNFFKNTKINLNK